MADRPRVLHESMLPTVLDGRVAMARRSLRPVSLLLIEVLELDDSALPAARTDLVEALLGTTFRESDVCAHRRDGVFVFILEDTSEDGAVWTAERFRRTLAGVRDGLRFCAGIASYPGHGLEADVVLTKAEHALRSAREWQRDRIEVATGP